VDVAQLVLDYLRALVWPALGVVALLLLREPLRTFIREMQRFRLSAGGAEMEASRRVEAMEEAAQNLAAPPSRNPAIEQEDRRRKEIEDLINQSVRLGWELRTAGARRVPAIGITWRPDDGKPQVTLTGLLENGDTVSYWFDSGQRAHRRHWGHWEAGS
jgi:hypothetical protein